MQLKGITKGVSVAMEEKRSNNHILGKEGTNKRDREIATTEVKEI